MKKIYNDKIIEVFSFPVKHSIPTCGFLFKEKSTERRMIKEKIKKLDLTIESIKKFKNSENCEVNGVLIDYNDVTKPQEFNQDLMVIVLILNMMKILFHI